MSLRSYTDSNKNIAGDFVAANDLDHYTPTEEVASANILIKLTSLNASAATFEVRLMDGDDCVIASAVVPKTVDSDTVACIVLRNIPLLASEAHTVAVKSSNSSDTSVGYIVTWLDAALSADLADGGRLDLLVDGIKTVTDALADVDSTGTETVTAAKALELLLAVMVNKASRADANSDWSVKGRDDTTDLLTAWPVPSSTQRNKAIIE